uniref:Uncharacterized protein n=1 Tax=Thermosporothrix sp. COM3 TaxID=2490863 RepID=A0A455SMM1_9CHLR|nr:hypothetical protein KTC_44340 [Thermosporothrix sp. COM3]
MANQNTPNKATTGKKRQKGTRPQIGGSAVPGARSTQPKQMPTSNNPQEQQLASYNREMRRRMEKIGAGPAAEENRLEKMREKRKRKLDLKKQRAAEEQERLRRQLAPKRARLDRKVYYFIFGTLLLIVLIIVLFLLFR